MSKKKFNRNDLIRTADMVLLIANYHNLGIFQYLCMLNQIQSFLK